MIDVNKITSMLAKLGDPQLQQYAQMHKNDPYIMSLAMSESNRRKEVRSAGQGAQGMQEQPKVVDQMVAEMAPQQLPEDQGIGQLPAGNMDFASGGIIAFADGGDVERFNGSQSQFVQDIMGIPDRYTAYQQRIRESDALKAESDRRMAEAKRQRLEAQQKTSFANYLFGSPEREAEGKAELAQLAAPVQAPKISPTYSPADYSGMDRRIMSGSQQPSIQSITPPAVKAAPTVDTTRKGPSPGAGPAPAPVAGPSAKPDTGGLDTLMAEYERKQDLAKGASKNADVQYASSLRGEATKLVADEEKRIKDQIDPYKDREIRLLKQEKGLEGMGDKYLGLALLQAGAAMMTTPGGIGTALGKGVQVGSERYVQGIEKINAAKDKFAEARDRLDDLRLNRADMNARDIRAAKTEARTLERQAEGLFYTGTKEYLKMTDKNLTTLLGLAADDLKTTRQIDAERANVLTREGGANARAGRNQQLEVLQAVSKDPTLAAAYKAMHGKGEDVMGQYNDFLKANPALAMDPKAAFTQFLMTKSAFAQLGAPTVTDKAAGPVRKQP